MSKERECAEYIRQVVGKTAFNTFLCKVKSIEGATCTVERVMDGMIIWDVRLNAHITENEGLVIFPKKDSFVLITDIDGDKWFVSQCSQIDNITLDVDSTIVINGGENDGMVKIKELTDKLNDLVNWCISHTHSGVITAVTGGSGGPAVGTTGNSGAPTSQPTSFSKTDYENEKIKH